jgi:electron transport complex protein RnfC
MGKCEELLETIDIILDINDISEAIIAIKKTNSEIIKKFKEYMGSYLKIKICEVPNRYPMGWERVLIKQVKNIKYDRFPIEQGIIVNNISTIYAINQALKFNKPLIERIVTFTGDGLDKPQNVLVKVGTPVKEIIDYIGGKKENTILIAGGPMMGNTADDDLVVTADLNCILLMAKVLLDEEYKDIVVV